jgi:hypothetical protein
VLIFVAIAIASTSTAQAKADDDTTKRLNAVKLIPQDLLVEAACVGLLKDPCEINKATLRLG